ncbi:hypothetical protein LMG26840_02241 [Achromobacter dolens]|nr:hypothetical protein LMG26840_02241 [Achromobacter dolens]
MGHGVPPDRTHDGLTWIVVAAVLAEAMRPLGIAMELHDFA